MNLHPRRGQILIGVILVMLVLSIIVPAIVLWVQQESKISVKDRQSTTAFHLAEAAVERGFWKVKSATSTCAMAMSGDVITGYDFDTTYSDITGGTYRIRISSTGTNSVMIVGEGRDSSTKETRAISAVFRNQTISSPLLTSGNLNWKKGFRTFWGPIMSQGDITMEQVVAEVYYPRKYSKGVVTGTTTNPRDTTGISPPNTDGEEWWSNYQYVPELPILDFAALRSSAAATGTLNVYGCKKNGAAWDTRSSCSGYGAVANHADHFGNPWNHPKSPQYDSTDYVWYYDGNLVLRGEYCGSNNPCGQSTGLKGTLIVRGNLTIDSPGEYDYSGPVPADAWEDHGKITKTTWDTTATREYPADIGFHQTTGTFAFGTDTWCQGGSCGWRTTVGMRGFTYVGGILTVPNSNGFMDFNGAVWVVGDVDAQGASANAFCGIFFNDNLQLPTLNVILVRQSWKEIGASSQAWP